MPKGPVVAESVGVAERPVGWSPLAVNASLGLGALLLVTGLVLKLRR
ncbi:hypothetical protein [Paludisphaera soli]|nr:hypothetical protein [Paludisphaera soli]